ncbi:hypothetical protein QYE80_27210 [Pseudomonas tohonis]|nr:hypothetical protein [Pseudomonas tohonis]
MSLAQERSAIRSSVSSSRASTLKRDLNSLESSRRKVQELNTLERKGVRPATRGRGVWVEKAVGGVGGGIASPLIETAYTDRQYHPDQTLVSTDGILSFKVKPIKQIKQADANDNEVIQILAAPVTTP